MSHSEESSELGIASKIVSSCNELARVFYQSHGYEVPKGFAFHEATHPQERSMWNLAVMAYERIEGTDVLEALNELEAAE